MLSRSKIIASGKLPGEWFMIFILFGWISDRVSRFIFMICGFGYSDYFRQDKIRNFDDFIGKTIFMYNSYFHSRNYVEVFET